MIRKVKTNDKSNMELAELYSCLSTGSCTLVQSRQVYTSIDYLSTIGYNLPNYHARLRSGELLPHTPFDQYHLKSIKITGQYDYSTWNTSKKTAYTHVYWSGGGWKPTTMGAPAPSVSDLSRYCVDAGDLVQEAAAGIYSEGFDLLTFVAELTDVYQMFRHIVKRFIKLNLRPKELKSFASDWLSYRYGWLTFISDIVSLNELIRTFNDKNRTRFCNKKKTMFSTSNTSVNEKVLPHSSGLETFVEDVSISLSGCVTADIVVPKLQINPLVTAWELIPLSFVVDWFINVGSTLESWSFLLKKSNYTASMGYSITISKTATLVQTEFDDLWKSGRIAYDHQFEGVLHKRIPCNVSLRPHFLLKMNRFKVLDLISLLIQRRKG